MRCEFSLDAMVPQTFVRMLVFKDKANNVLIQDLLEDPTATEMRYLSPYDTDYKFRWNVLYDKTHRLDTASIPAKSFFIKLKGKAKMMTTFMDSSNLVTSGAIKIAFVNNLIPTQSQSIIRVYSRVYYTDG